MLEHAEQQTLPGRRRTPAFYSLTVSAVTRMCEDAVAITFDVPPGLHEAFTFDAGQSVTLRRTIDGREHRRSYSICAPVGAPPRIGVREIPDGLFSRWLVREVTPGTVIDVQTPSGGLRADPTVGAHHLCIAAGSGITPLMSIAASVLANPESAVTLLYGNRTTASVMFAEDLADLKDRYHSRFELVHVLSREPRDVELFSGRLDADRLRALVTELVDLPSVAHVWLCGPLTMVEGARDLLVGLGVDPARVHMELFFVDEPPPVFRHTDPLLEGVTSELTVILDGRSTVLPVPRDVAVLDSAQQVRADLPFACKGGVCGTCRANVTDGEVQMVRNYALEATELQNGFVLTCQSFPVSDAVTVDYDA